MRRLTISIGFTYLEEGSTKRIQSEIRYEVQ